MNRKKRTRRGVTLAELCVVMAVIAIVSTMVVSFTVLMQARTSLIAADRDTIADIGSVESALDTFIRKYDSDQYTLKIVKYYVGETVVSNTLDEYYALQVSTSDDTVVAKLMLGFDTDEQTRTSVDSVKITEGKTVTSSLPLHMVTKLEFEIVSDSGNDSALVICKVTYTRTSGSEQTSETATICHAVRAMKTN